MTLSVRLREGTKESHRLAEGSAFIRQFVAGNLLRETYREFLVQLHYIYATLEKHQEHLRAHPVFEKIYFPELFRVGAIGQDLNFYYGDSSWQSVAPHAATKDYVQRLTVLSGEWVEGLVAHHYTRYLGDLSGGQALKRFVAKMFKLPAEAGLAFYEFPQIADHAQFKAEYRARLDAMPVDEATAQKIVDEASYAFALNQRVFESMTPSIQ
jgi:heme oxygenase (biliverdin-producing, ferredoxin)